MNTERITGIIRIITINNKRMVFPHHYQIALFAL